MDELKECAAWMGASERRREEIVHGILARLPRFEFAYARHYGPTENPFYIVSLRDTGTGVVFNLIPGGAFQMGFSQGERGTLRLFLNEEMQDPEAERSPEVRAIREVIDDEPPSRAVYVEPFLMARFPVLKPQFAAVCDQPLDAWLNSYDWDVATIRRDQVNAVESSMLARGGYRLPWEAQWEYACRGGTTGLSYSHPTQRPDLSCCTGLHSDSLCDSPVVNPFGMASMGGYGEVCADVDENYRPRLDEAADPPVRIVRGGAAMLYPWQGSGEWMLLLSASRWNTAGLRTLLAIRPVLLLPVE